MWENCRVWNRKNIKNYIEVFLRVPIHILADRDSKGLYSSSIDKRNINVVGIDIPVEEPRDPDLIIDNYGETTPCHALEQVLQLLPTIKV